MRRISNDEYKFSGDVYKSGLVMKRLSPASLAVTNAPHDISRFAAAMWIVNSPFFGSMTCQAAQQSIKVRQQVRVVHGEQQGWVRCPVDITDDLAVLVRNTDDDTPALQVPLKYLLPVYRPGNRVKFQWGVSHGIVTSVDEIHDKVSYIERDSHREVSTLILATWLIKCSHTVPHFPEHCGAIHASTFVLPVHTGDLGSFQQTQ